MTIHFYLSVALLRYNQEIQEIYTQYKKIQHFVNKLASTGKSQYLV